MHKTKPKPQPTLIFTNCSMLIRVCVSLCTTVLTAQHRTVLIIIPLILQTIHCERQVKTRQKWK